MAKVDEEASLEFKWLKKRGRGGKERKVQFYESFVYDEVEYALYDCVYIYKEGLPLPYIGKLIKIWELLDNKARKVKVQWFFYPGEISNWLGDMKTLENEILIASGEGPGLVNINPLEAIAGRCNVVCISKDRRNTQPSEEDRKAADFIFYRAFDVQSCTISDKMGEKVGEVEVKYIFNRKEGESISSLPLSTSDMKEENQNTTPSKDMADRDPMGSDEVHDRPLKKLKRDLEVAQDAVKFTDIPSNKNKVESSVVGQEKPNQKNGKVLGTEKGKISAKDAQDPAFNKNRVEISIVSDGKPNQKNGEVLGSEKGKISAIVALDPVSNKNKVETSIVVEEKPNQKNGKVLGSEKRKISTTVTDDEEGRTLKNRKAAGSFKMPDDKKHGSVQKLIGNTNDNKGKDLVANSVLKSRYALDSSVINKELQGEEIGESKRKRSKVSPLLSGGDKKTLYHEFVVTPKPFPDKSGWFRRLPWEEILKNAYDQGTAILLHNVDPDYTSREIEDLIWHAFTENCEAKILQRSAVSSPHYCQALIILKTKEASQKILSKLDEECLMLSNGRPLVATPCPPISSKKNSKFFGHLSIDKLKFQNQRDMDEAVSTSHFSQPNTIEYDMAMEWFLLQARSKKWWETIHKQQGNELKKLESSLVRK